jgi:hypothetical protein
MNIQRLLLSSVIEEAHCKAKKEMRKEIMEKINEIFY